MPTLLLSAHAHDTCGSDREAPQVRPTWNLGIQELMSGQDTTRLSGNDPEYS